MDINFANTENNADPDKARLTLEELARGMGGGLAVDIQDVSINITPSGDTHVIVDNTPNVHVTNTPTVTVSGDVTIASSNPLAAYAIANIDETSVTPKYYGYLNKDGGWYIARLVSGDTFTYAKGNSGYNWANRASATYNSFDVTF